MDVIIYHNPDCGTSRNTLALIRNAGVEPHVIEYLKTPPSRVMLLATHRANGRLHRAICCGRKARPIPNSALAIPA